MATVREKGKFFHIQWYDSITNKLHSKSTGLPVTEANRKRAEKLAKELQRQLSEKSLKLKKIGIKQVSIKAAYNHFLKNNQHKHPKTIKDYNRFYNKFIEAFDEKLACSEINKMDVEDWLNDIKKLKLAKNSIHAYGKQLTHFLNFLFEYNYTPMFKINKEVKTRPEVKEKIVFTDEAIFKIFNSLDEKNENFITSIYLLFYTGLRSSDLLTITKKRVNLKEKTISYYSPKRKVYREVAFHDDLVEILTNRLRNLNEDDALVNYQSVENLGRAVRRFLDGLGFDGMGYTARTFRKTFITLCRSRYKMDASIVRELVGHSHTNTADRFYNEIGLDAMREELKKFKRPVAKK